MLYCVVLKGWLKFLEIIFVGQCEVFALIFFFPLGREAHRSVNEASIL